MKYFPKSMLLLAMLVAPLAANAQSYFSDCISNTGNDATIIIDAAGNHVLGTGTFQAGDEIGIFTEDGLCVGADSWTGQNIAITVWGDDPLQPDKVGLLGDESFMIRVWDKSEDQLYGTSYGTVTFQMASDAPFRGSTIYAKNALYMTSQIEAIGEQRKGKNRVKTKGRKVRGSERGVDNTAMFSISRTGPVNNDLTVVFALTGSAIEGYDYLPSVTVAEFEPGQRTVFVIVHPIDDGEVEDEEQVTLTLQPDGAYELVADSITAFVTIVDGGSSLGTEEESLANGFALAPPYPNPFSSRTALTFQTDQTQRILVDVYNVIGKRVAQIFDGTVQAGVEYELLVDAQDLPNGLYMVKAVGSRTTVRSVVLQR
ncbi:MAG: T9SS type A sorting domain-containing protein [Rhodothermales bacterium]|nr:T9SS type A sorting domain-containing protein [Rhodothermales bacterium]